LLPFLRAARQGGHDTLVVGPPGLREAVEGAGFGFHPGGEPPEDEVAAIRERLPTAPPGVASVLGNRELFGRMATAAMLPAMEEVCGAWGPDVILREPCEYASAVVAHRTGIRSAQVAISLAQAEAASITVAEPALEAHGRGLVDALRGAPYLSSFPASLDPSPFPATVRFRDEAAPGATAPGALGAAGPPLPAGAPEVPVVYMTFGTVLGYMSMAAAVYRVALRAVDGLAVRCLLTVGRRFDREALGPVPDNVHVETWVDQADVLPLADVVLCHGGSGTAFGAVGAGVPVVAVPLFADQFENGRRIAAAGAGLVVEAGPGADGSRRPLAEDDAPRIAAGIETVLADPSFRRRARALAAEMGAAPGAGSVLGALVDGALGRDGAP
jgi:UDP:flavonoid glycosyltransferase YjiC (YdhE family)